MPFADDEVIEKLEQNISKLPSVTTMLEEGNTELKELRELLRLNSNMIYLID